MIKRTDKTIEYIGMVYLRPCDRGVLLEDTSYKVLYGSEIGSEDNPYADDLFHAMNNGDTFKVKITIERLP